MKQTGIRLMAADTQWMDIGSRVEANGSHPQGLRKALQMDKSLETTSTQRKDFGLMAVSQRTAMPRIIVEQQTDVRLKATSAQRMNFNLMAALQWTTTSRVFSSGRMDSSL